MYFLFILTKGKKSLAKKMLKQYRSMWRENYKFSSSFPQIFNTTFSSSFPQIFNTTLRVTKWKHHCYWLCNIPLYSSLSLQSPVTVHLGCFCFFAFINNTAVNFSPNLCCFLREGEMGFPWRERTGALTPRGGRTSLAGRLPWRWSLPGSAYTWCRSGRWAGPGRTRSALSLCGRWTSCPCRYILHMSYTCGAGQGLKPSQYPGSYW